MGKICKKLRKQWCQNNLEAAISAVQAGESQRNACARFEVPRRTLRRYLRDGISVKRLGGPTILTSEQEADFVARIIRFCDIGLPLTPTLVRHQVFRYCQINNIKHKFNKKTECAGKAWLTQFLHRHPVLSKRKAQLMNPARAQKLNKPIVEDYFNKLGNILDELNLKDKPHCLYNMDEKGCRLTIHHQQSVMAQKGAKRVHIVAPEHAENVTIVGCVNAIGNCIPPMVIFKGKRLKPEFNDNLPPGSLVRMAVKGSMTTELFTDFIRHLARYKTEGRILLIFDGASSHLDYRIAEAADEHNISLLCLPSNTTHELQPLDKSVYRSFESHWDQQLLRYWDIYPERHLNKSRFNVILSKVWPLCMTPSNILNGFKTTGIYPFNPDAIPEAAFAPSVPSIIPDTQFKVLELPEESASDSDEFDIPLSVLKKRLKSNQTSNVTLNQSFQELLPTPQNKIPENKKARRKALNYKAQRVTKELFNKEGSEEGSSCSKSTLPRKSLPKESWYCSVCEKDEQLDMRICVTCSQYYHEVCVGLTVDDMDDFECFNCT